MDPKTGEKKLEPLPFIVPGARFNEMYYWDSVSCFACINLGDHCS